MCYSVRFPCSLTSIEYVYTTKPVLHEHVYNEPVAFVLLHGQIYDDSIAKPGLKSELPPIDLDILIGSALLLILYLDAWVFSIVFTIKSGVVDEF